MQKRLKIIILLNTSGDACRSRINYTLIVTHKLKKRDNHKNLEFENQLNCFILA